MLQIEGDSQILVSLLQGSQLPPPWHLLSLMQNANMVADDLYLYLVYTLSFAFVFEVYV